MAQIKNLYANGIKSMELNLGGLQMSGLAKNNEIN